MLQSIQIILQKLWYSLPIRLLVRQLHSHKLLLLIWIFLLAILSGGISESFGGPYLFLEPEYLGLENFWSTFLVGSALGSFIFAYTITFYINESYRFHFIGFCKHPFFLLAYNNFIVPGSLLAAYFYQFLSYHHSMATENSWHVFELTMGLIVGILVVFAISASYFFAETSFFTRFGKKLEKEIEKKKPDRSRWVILGKARESIRSNQRADYYLEFPFRIKKVTGPDKARLRELIAVLNQHHGKLLLLQVVTFALVAFLGLMEDNPLFQIPAGASFLLLLSFLMMAIGAATFWFRKAGLLALSIVFGVIYFYGDMDWLKEQHYVAGIDYTAAPVEYSMEHLATLQNDSIHQQDRAATLAYLNNWKARYQEKYGQDVKPRAVFVSASGGGLRSAFWTFSIMQYLDSLSSGRMTDEIRLFTGASGGMFGLSYFRELQMQRAMGHEINIQDRTYRENMSKDLLNRIFFRMFSDLILPSRKVMIDDQKMTKEAGYSFDRQVAKNLPELAHRRLGDYARPEAEGVIAPLILAPSIINQGRKLFISSQPVSYLANPGDITAYYQYRPDGVEFRRMFANHRPDSLYFVSALRMNATFPVVMPVVSLPSTPTMQVMDAGALDNFGTQTAVKYLFEFREWFEENTDGIVLLQIRDSDREEPIDEVQDQGILSKLSTPIGGGYKSMLEAKDLANDHLLQYMKEWYFGPMEVISFEYPIERLEQPASLSWHLTRREKRALEASLNNIRKREESLAFQRIYLPLWLAHNHP
ncbi:MAG: hypothetical protein NWR72_16750 [Bacteroidia bacterium]|nr:hypothetical protein [Bacteroidia bacterium]